MMKKISLSWVYCPINQRHLNGSVGFVSSPQRSSGIQSLKLQVKESVISLQFFHLEFAAAKLPHVNFVLARGCWDKYITADFSMEQQRRHNRTIITKRMDLSYPNPEHQWYSHLFISFVLLSFSSFHKKNLYTSQAPSLASSSGTALEGDLEATLFTDPIHLVRTPFLCDLGEQHPQRKREGAMAVEEEGRKGIPSLLSSGEENIASNITQVTDSLPSSSFASQQGSFGLFLGCGCAWTPFINFGEDQLIPLFLGTRVYFLDEQRI